MLFMNSKITLLNTINQSGGLGDLLGDFLTQGYHSKWGAAFIQSALLTAWDLLDIVRFLVSFPIQ